MQVKTGVAAHGRYSAETVLTNGEDDWISVVRRDGDVCVRSFGTAMALTPTEATTLARILRDYADDARKFNHHPQAADDAAQPETHR